jgi:predicted esterase
MNSPLSFVKFRAEFMRLYHLGAYADAYSWLRLGGGQYPQQASLLFFWRACILSLLKEPTEAIQVLQDGLNLGYWWAESLLRKDTDLASLQGLPEFETIVRTCETLHQESEKENPAEILVYPPEKGIFSPTPLMILLHSRSGNPEEMMFPYLGLIQQGWLVAVVKSSQILFPGGYSWDDRERAYKDILDMVDELKRNFPASFSPMVVSGFSQGGGLALEIATKRLLPLDGALAIAPYIRDIQASISSPAPPISAPPRIYLVTGDEDTGQEGFARIIESLQTHRIPFQQECHPHLGHEFPADFEPSLQKGLAFILEKKIEQEIK